MCETNDVIIIRSLITVNNIRDFDFVVYSKIFHVLCGSSTSTETGTQKLKDPQLRANARLKQYNRETNLILDGSSLEYQI